MVARHWKLLKIHIPHLIVLQQNHVWICLLVGYIFPIIAILQIFGVLQFVIIVFGTDYMIGLNFKYDGLAYLQNLTN